MTSPYIQGEVPDWILDEDVDVTLIHVFTESETIGSIFLVARVSAPGAVTLTFDDSGIILTNGEPRDLGEETMQYCSLIDDVSSDGVAKVGVTVRSVASRDGES
jgi:hypothetical protein